MGAGPRSFGRTSQVCPLMKSLPRSSINLTWSLIKVSISTRLSQRTFVADCP